MLTRLKFFFEAENQSVSDWFFKGFVIGLFVGLLASYFFLFYKN
jgi:hypothetical protein